MLTEAAGGEFYDLAGPKSDLAFCPLRDIDDEADVAWAVGWIEVLCELNGLQFRAQASKRRRRRRHATATLANADPDRAVRERAGHRNPRCAAALHGDGSAGVTARCRIRQLGDGRMLAFETENLLQLDDKAVIPVLLYLFRRIEQRLDGSPTLILLDEAWSYLQHELFRDRLKDWLKTMRRKNAVVVMATQQISDIANSRNRRCRSGKLPDQDSAAECGIEKSGLARVLRPRWTERARTGNYSDEHSEAALLRRQQAGPPSGRISGVGKVALSWVGVNGREERQIVESVMEQFRTPGGRSGCG